jgi:hypothetical protein
MVAIVGQTSIYVNSASLVVDHPLGPELVSSFYILTAP